MLEKILRYPLNEQMKALLEKIDSPDFLEPATDTSSLPYHKNNPEYRVESLLKAGGLSRYEQALIKRALARAQRARTLNTAMEIVLNLPDGREESLTMSERGLMTPTQASMYNAVVKGEGAAIRSSDPFSIYNDVRTRNQAINTLKAEARKVTVVKKPK